MYPLFRQSAKGSDTFNTSKGMVKPKNKFKMSNFLKNNVCPDSLTSP